MKTNELIDELMEAVFNMKSELKSVQNAEDDLLRRGTIIKTLKQYKEGYHDHGT